MSFKAVLIDGIAVHGEIHGPFFLFYIQTGPNFPERSRHSLLKKEGIFPLTCKI